jgi:hypothetical protein
LGCRAGESDATAGENARFGRSFRPWPAVGGVRVTSRAVVEHFRGARRRAPAQAVPGLARWSTRSSAAAAMDSTGVGAGGKVKKGASLESVKAGFQFPVGRIGLQFIGGSRVPSAPTTRSLSPSPCIPTANVGEARCDVGFFFAAGHGGAMCGGRSAMYICSQPFASICIICVVLRPFASICALASPPPPSALGTKAWRPATLLPRGLGARPSPCCRQPYAPMQIISCITSSWCSS